MLSRYLGSHSIRTGGEVRYERGWAARFNSVANMTFNTAATANTTSGAAANTGIPWASFLLDTMATSSNAQLVPIQYSDTEMWAFFIQDDFKVSRNLSLNFGLRYEYEGDFWDPENRLSQRIDLTDPIPGLQAAIAPKLAAQTAGKTIGQLMAESVGQSSHVYNGAFYFTEPGSKRATRSDRANRP